jgi:hypothetical protein
VTSAGISAIGKAAVAIQEEPRSVWSRLIAHDPKPPETTGNQRQLVCRSDQERPCNQGQAASDWSLTENRGVGSSIPALATSEVGFVVRFPAA